MSFETRTGDPIANAPAVSTAEDGSFLVRSRETRRLVVLDLVETIASKNPVTLRIDADDYETMRLDVEGKKTFRAPIELVPLGEAP